MKPLPDTAWANVTQPFGVPSSHYVSGVHNGTDFGCPVGTPVVAPFDGYLTYRINYAHPTLGKAVYFRFEKDGAVYFTRFLHLSEALPPGPYKQGDLIAKTGNTGDSTGPHLHLDLWNRPIDASLIRTRAGVARHLLDPVTFFA